MAGEAGEAEEGNQVDGEDVAGEEDVVEKVDEEGVVGVAEKVDEADGEDVAEKEEEAGVAGVVDVAGVAGVADVVDVDELDRHGLPNLLSLLSLHSLQPQLERQPLQVAPDHPPQGEPNQLPEGVFLEEGDRCRLYRLIKNTKQELHILSIFWMP